MAKSRDGATGTDDFGHVQTFATDNRARAGEILAIMGEDLEHVAGAFA